MGPMDPFCRMGDLARGLMVFPRNTNQGFQGHFSRLVVRAACTAWLEHILPKRDAAT